MGNMKALKGRYSGIVIVIPCSHVRTCIAHGTRIRVRMCKHTGDRMRCHVHVHRLVLLLTGSGLI